MSANSARRAKVGTPTKRKRKGPIPKGNFAFISESQKAWVRLVPVKAFYGTWEAALILGTYEANIYRLISIGQLKPLMVEGVTKVPHAEIIHRITWVNEIRAAAGLDKKVKS